MKMAVSFVNCFTHYAAAVPSGAAPVAEVPAKAKGTAPTQGGEHNSMIILVTPTLECSAHSSIMRLGGMNGSFLHVAIASHWRRSVDGTRVTSPRPYVTR